MQDQKTNPTKKGERKEIKITIKKADGMQGFAAYKVSPANSERHEILLNVYATFFSAVEERLDVKTMLVEHLMHEFGHILQNFFNLEMTEEFVEKIVQSYAKKYGEKSYEDIHGNQTI